jgi:hypothetical protein
MSKGEWTLTAILIVIFMASIGLLVWGGYRDSTANAYCLSIGHDSGSMILSGSIICGDYTVYMEEE